MKHKNGEDNTSRKIFLNAERAFLNYRTAQDLGFSENWLLNLPVKYEIEQYSLESLTTEDGQKDTLDLRR